MARPLPSRSAGTTLGSEAGFHWSLEMTENKRTVERYMDGFRTSDHAQVLACLTDDVEWEMPGAFHLRGQEAFDKEIENGPSPAVRPSPSPA